MDVKKMLLVLGGSVIVLSGVAMVSAYEAHIINVKAKVENALTVGVSRLNYGTVFPEEFMLKDFSVAISGSFCSSTQKRVRNIDYELWVEWKPKTFDAQGNPTSWYPWLGDALWLAQVPPLADSNGDGKINLADDTFPTRTVWTNLGDPPTATPPGVGKILGPVTLTKPAPGAGNEHFWKLALDVPVFEHYYNKTTDPTPKPSGLSKPSVEILDTDIDRYFPDGVNLGLNLKIQVTNIYGPPFLP